MWERMFDLVLGLKKEHRLMIVITLIYAVTLFGITVDVEAMENWLQLVGYTIRTLCIACIIQLSVFFLTNIFWKELNRGLNKTFVVISGNVLSLAFLLFPFSISYIDMTAESMKLSSLNTERNRIDSMVRYYENLKSLDSSFSENLDSLILEEKKTLIRVIKEIDLKQFKIEEKQKRYEKPLVSILFLLQIFGFYILILYSSYFDRTNKVNRVIAVENIPYRKKVRSYFCDKVLKPLVLLLSVFLWGFLFFLWLRQYIPDICINRNLCFALWLIRKIIEYMITYLIIGITVVLSFICFSNRELFMKLAFIPYRTIRNHEYYRIVTHGFIHADMTHLLVNMFTFWSFGLYIERTFRYMGFGSGAYLAFYFGGMIVASLYDLIKRRNDPYYVSIGASGAVSAVLFTSIFLDPWGKILFFAVLPVPGIVFGLLYLAYCQYMAKQTGDNINHNAHFYGAIYGLIFPMLLEPSLLHLFLSQLTFKG